MPDATEFLIEYLDSESETRYERIADSDDAIEYLRQLVGQGKAAILYQRVPFEVQIGVTVKAPRKRRKTPSPADKPASDPPTGPGNGEAGELKDCEARFADDPACQGAIKRDPVTRGWFCPIHIDIPESIRHECHAKRGVRNRPVRVAHAG